MSAARIRVQVVYALPRRCWLREVELPADARVREAIAASGLEREIEGLVVDAACVGIFSRPVALDAALRDGDRVELYRPLECDPKEVRRRRAAAGRGG